MYFSHLDKLQVNDFTIYLQKGAFSKIFRNIAIKHILLATVYHHIHEFDIIKIMSSAQQSSQHNGQPMENAKGR